MRTRSAASCSSVRNSVATSLQPVSDAPRTHCTTASPGLGWSGKRSMPSSNSTGSVSAQLSRNAARSPSTAGPVDAEVGVAPLALVARVALPLVGDADAAGEADRLVDDQHLAVGAVVDRPEPEPAHRPEPAHAARRPLHVVDERRVHRSGAPGVEQHAHPHAGLRAARRARRRTRCRSRPPSRRRSGSRSCARPRRSRRAWPGRSRRRCAGRRCGCPRSPGRR